MFELQAITDRIKKNYNYKDLFEKDMAQIIDRLRFYYKM
jgi:hypothetical protein